MFHAIIPYEKRTKGPSQFYIRNSIDRLASIQETYLPYKLTDCIVLFIRPPTSVLEVEKQQCQHTLPARNTRGSEDRDVWQHEERIRCTNVTHRSPWLDIVTTSVSN